MKIMKRRKINIVFKNRKKMINIFFNYGDNKSKNLIKKKKSLRYIDLMRFKKRKLFWPTVSMCSSLINLYLCRKTDFHRHQI